MSCPCQYSESLPIGCVTDMIAAIRGTQSGDRTKVLANAAHNLSGYLLRVTVGTPDEMFGASGPVLSHSETDALKELDEALNEDLPTQEESFGASDEGGLVDPATLAMIIELVKYLLNKFLSK